jgi:hypothetical protein
MLEQQPATKDAQMTLPSDADALNEIAQNTRNNAVLGKLALQVQIRSYWNQELAKPRNRDPKRLLGYGAKVYSQGDEDGQIAEIFRRIGCASKVFVEFGVQGGIECNSLKLLLEGWQGVWFEGDGDAVQRIETTHRTWLATDQLRVRPAFITAENIDGLIAETAHTTDVDLLCIDVDFNDYWIWRAIACVRPRVVVIEYNPVWAPPLSVVVPYAPDGRWNGDNYFGASLGALVTLGAAKGYSLVGCSFTGANAFFVRNDLCADHFVKPATAEEHYEPARYFFAQLSTGHEPAIGPLVTV